MKSKIKLQYLIIGVALLAFFLTSLSSIISGYQMNKTNLGESAMETNRVYAQKLASTANNYLEESLKLLGAHSNELATNLDDSKYLMGKADLIRNETSAFNSIVIINKEGLVLATSPQSLDLKGVKLTRKATKHAIKTEKPYISQPYESISGRLIIFISAPLFNEKNEYVGLIGGTIYLKENNVLYDLLGKHPYEDGSSVYVVDNNGTIVYDEKSANIGENVYHEKTIKEAIREKQTGVVEGINTNGEKAYIAHSYVKLSGWTIFAQRPAADAEKPAGEMVNKMVFVATPLLILSLVVVIFAAYKIAKPLQRLAELTELSKSQDEANNFKNVPAWYYEAIQLKESLIISFGYLHNQVDNLTDQSKTDPLTGLFNRRTLNEVMEKWQQEDAIYSIILFDVDHFKKVNDTYGHDVGDIVLKYVATTSIEQKRPEDLCCRFGGEEFVMLLPNTTRTEAYEFAEKLRKKFESTLSPSGERITISAGVAEYPAMSRNSLELLKKADKAMYKAKNDGRNKVYVAD